MGQPSVETDSSSILTSMTNMGCSVFILLIMFYALLFTVWYLLLFIIFTVLYNSLDATLFFLRMSNMAVASYRLKSLVGPSSGTKYVSFMRRSS